MAETETTGAHASALDAFYVIDELRSAVDMVVRGIQALHPAEGVGPDLDATLQHLAAGFERLLKLTYTEAAREIEGQRPAARSLQSSYGHELVRLARDLTDLVARVPSYAGRPAVRKDLDFIRDHDDLRGLLEVLSAFGQGGRYHRLDSLLNPAEADVEADPRRWWQAIEMELLQARPDWLQLIEPPGLGAEAAAAFEITRRLQRLARAVARMWAWDALGEQGGQLSAGSLDALLYLNDDELGASPAKG